MGDRIQYRACITLAWVVGYAAADGHIFPLLPCWRTWDTFPGWPSTWTIISKACAHGSRRLPCRMGFVLCRVIACRIIDSRERLICYHYQQLCTLQRPVSTLITIAVIFPLAPPYFREPLQRHCTMLAAIVLGIFITLFVSSCCQRPSLRGCPPPLPLNCRPTGSPGW